ncbi:hypothetical protein MTO96_009614 [Rhipicephalus appendiculatus]
MRCGTLGAGIIPSQKFPRSPGVPAESVRKEPGSSKHPQEHGHSSVSAGAGGGTLDSPGRVSHERDRAAATATNVSAQAKLRLVLASATVTWGTFLVLAASSVTLAITPNAMYLLTGLVTSTIHHLGRLG